MGAGKQVGRGLKGGHRENRIPISSRVTRRLHVSVVVLVAALGGLVAACSGGEATTTAVSGASSTQALTTATQAVTATEAVTTTTLPPTTSTSVVLVPMSKTEIARWKTDALAFADRFYGAWPDVDASFARFADDATFYDPTDGDFLIEGKQQIVALHQWMFSSFPGFRFRQQAVYLSGGGAAYKGVLENLWPPGVPEPADHPPVEGLDLFRLKDGLVVNWDIWSVPTTLEMLSMACFAPGEGGSEQLRAIADRYLAAWSSGDKDRIAALYRDDAVFSDGMRGVQAQGAAAIGELGDTRFGSGGPLTLEGDRPLRPDQRRPRPVYRATTRARGHHRGRDPLSLHRCREGRIDHRRGPHHLRARHAAGSHVRHRSGRPDHPRGGVSRRRQPSGVRPCPLSPGTHADEWDCRGCGPRRLHVRSRTDSPRLRLPRRLERRCQLTTYYGHRLPAKDDPRVLHRDLKGATSLRCLVCD